MKKEETKQPKGAEFFKRPEDYDQGTLNPTALARPAENPNPKGGMLPSRAGGVYMPPFKLR